MSIDRSRRYITNNNGARQQVLEAVDRVSGRSVLYQLTQVATSVAHACTLADELYEEARRIAALDLSKEQEEILTRQAKYCNDGALTLMTIDLRNVVDKIEREVTPATTVSSSSLDVFAQIVRQQLAEVDLPAEYAVEASKIADEVVGLALSSGVGGISARITSDALKLIELRSRPMPEYDMSLIGAIFASIGALVVMKLTAPSNVEADTDPLAYLFTLEFFNAFADCYL